ncbi:sugar kinase [Paenibacillus sp. BSR1-1]|uniref:sugar kinase n=1 Tax=Paenibacillus sp. BSR1-1 TaxID=3020845 RepID=UPI0025B0A90F|nr:sugar kinase [Paenibacillus sp. BSR1-1]MDN3018463.1 sugar kinase [Paenibacillus sp. BSR1-1]
MKKVVTLGEIMLRLSTQTGTRLNQADLFTVHYGGAEANVAVSLAHFGYETYFISKVPNNPLGEAVKKHLRSHGVHTDFLQKGGERLGTYYLETGVGERGPQVIYDRKYSSFSQLTKEDIQIEEMFKGAALFHVSGITLALSHNLRELTYFAIKKAKEMGVKISFDFNYRAKLWGQQEASEAIKPLLPYADFCFCGELDAIHILGFDKVNDSIPADERLKYYYQRIREKYPNIEYFCSTFRTSISASSNNLQGNLFAAGELYQSKIHHIEPIVDRVGGGDAFAAGVLYCFFEGLTPQEIISFATAASALKHTVHGDCNCFTKEEVYQFFGSEQGKIAR